MLTLEERKLNNAKACKRWRERNPAKEKARSARLNARYRASGQFRFWHLLRTFKLTKDAFESLLLQQGKLCLVCNKELLNDIAVDHDRQCCPGIKSCGNCIRGLLHKKCNAALGLLGDDPVVLRQAADYLEKFKC